MPITVQQAIDAVYSHLDDQNATRWTSAEVQSALSSALSRCVNDYDAAGGDRFREEITGTSTTAGVVSALSSIDVIAVQNVSVQMGNVWQRIRATRRADEDLVDAVVRTVRLQFVREPTLSTTLSNPLLTNAWRAFEDWVVAEAALQCGIKDNDMRPGLEALTAKAQNSVMSKLNTPVFRASAHDRVFDISTDLRWSWVPSTKLVYLSRNWMTEW